MYFVVIMAFALVLSDALPPSQCLLPVFRALPGRSITGGAPLVATLAVIVAQLAIVALAAGVSRRLTLARLDGTAVGHDRATETYSFCQRMLLGIIAVALAITLVLTPWAPLVREGWHLGVIPLVGDLVVLGPFALSILIAWIILYRVELQIRKAATILGGEESSETSAAPMNEATAALALAKKTLGPTEPTLGVYLMDKCRHQILIVAAPMSLIVLAKHFIDLARHDIIRVTTLPWAADAVLGIVSAGVLAIAPVLLRFVWATEPLPAGPLRERFVRTCRRIGLSYREILLWHTHGTAINAAVMGFVGPMRYIMVSDALLETMTEEEIEAVFGHEAGHVRHWHLQFFMLFGVVSMYIAGGVILAFYYAGMKWHLPIFREDDVLQLVALAALLAVWLFGFGWLSRRFERQADLYGVRCLTPDVKSCVARCPVHGGGRTPSANDPEQTAGGGQTAASDGSRQAEIGGLCVTSANLFGRTLIRIADLNGIPKDAPSWRHGSIGDRCRLVERLTADRAALQRFDRQLLWIKVGLAAAALVGTVIAGLIYGPDTWRAIHLWFRR